MYIKKTASVTTDLCINNLRYAKEEIRKCKSYKQRLLYTKVMVQSLIKTKFVRESASGRLTIGCGKFHFGSYWFIDFYLKKK